MKYKISISVNEEILHKIKEGIRKGKFRNRSHAFEFSVQEVLSKVSKE